MSSKKNLSTKEMNEAIDKGLQNFREAADASPTVNPAGYEDPALYSDTEGKGAMLQTLQTMDNAALNMSTIAAKPSNAIGGGVAPTKKKGATKEEDSEEEMQETVRSTEDYLADLFDEGELSETFMDKLVTVFEAALDDRISFVEASMQESFNKTLNEQVETIAEELSEKLDEFLSYVVNEWTEENKLAIERGIKADIAESFIEGLKSLFESHYIEMPEDKVSVVDELLDAKHELEEQLNTEIETNIRLRKERDATKARTIFVESCQGMTDMEIEKFYSLVENVEFETEEQFANKLAIIKESFITKPQNRYYEQSYVQPQQVLTEDVAEASHNAGADPLMEAYSRSFAFQNRNKNA
jgi:ribosomal protein L12E/L44/L45/RPP1/RPP2